MIFRKAIIIFAVLMGLFIYVNSSIADTITKPYTFSSGTTASAAQVNDNFDILYNQMNLFGSAIDIYDGNVGVGLTNPASPLHVASNEAVTHVFRVDGNALTDGSTAFMRNSNPESTGHVLYLQNQGKGTTLLVDSLSPDNRYPVLIRSDTKEGQAFRINADHLTTGQAAFIRNFNWDSSGKTMYLQNMGIGNALYVRQDNSGKMVDLGHYPRSDLGTPGDATALYIDVHNPIGNAYGLIVNRGKVGIGTTSPELQFEVSGDAGGTTPWQNDSDRRLKKNIEPIDHALDKVFNLEGVSFEWKDTNDHASGKQIGLIAQQVKDIVPEVVDKKGEYYSIQYAPLTALLIEAVKELKSENEDLKAIICEEFPDKAICFE